MKVSHSLDRKIRDLPGVERRRSMWGHETACVIEGKGFAHFHRQNEIDVRLTRGLRRKMHAELKEDRRVKVRSGLSHWITITLATKGDLDYALELVKLARNANRE